MKNPTLQTITNRLRWTLVRGKLMKRPLVVLATFLFVACLRANVEPLSANTYPPIHESEVLVFFSFEELQADSMRYERIALIFTMGQAESSVTSTSNQQQHISKARKEAAKLGANGIVLQSSDDSATEATVMAVRWWVEH